MKGFNNTFLIISLVLFIIFSVSASAATPNKSFTYNRSFMPPRFNINSSYSRDRSGGPIRGASGDAIQIYLDHMKKNSGKSWDMPNPLAARYIAQGEKSGKIENHHGRMRPNNKRYDTILILLVEFAGTDIDPNTGISHTGPLHNNIPEPDRTINNVDFWIKDFNRKHYENMLFNNTPGARSMFNYYLEQSGGIYTVDGKAYGWIKVDHSEWWYGGDVPGAWPPDGLNGPVWRLARDAVIAAGDSVPWANFDKEDPYDLDGDGIFDEPDGYVDHLMIVHANIGQEVIGYNQPCIWSHSWFVDYGFHGPCCGGVQTSDPDVWVGPYIAMPEDGTLGVFCHEYAHNLGLPDEYDTIYSGESNPGFWSLMGSGGHLSLPGEPEGTCPANLSIWGKYMLGWVDPIEINPGEMRENIRLKPVEMPGPVNKAIKINLPNYTYSFHINEPHSLTSEWYSDIGDNLNNMLTRTTALPPEAATLRFWTWYDIEIDFDYGYVEVSTDNGANWQSIPGNITTNDDPHGQNMGNGITGSSGDWVQALFELPAHTDPMLVRFRYWTDINTQGLGWTIDDIELFDSSNTRIFLDDCESGTGDWEASGWYIFNGTKTVETFHYYLAEWRQPIGFDASMSSWYYIVFKNRPYTWRERYSANPGMLLWYRDGQFSFENLVGVHPWRGGLLLVDAHPELILADDLEGLANLLFYELPHAPPDPPCFLCGTPPNMGLPFRSRIQGADATFGLSKTIESPIYNFFVDTPRYSWVISAPTNSKIPELPPVPVFDDSIKYIDESWAPWFGFASYLPELGWIDSGYIIRRSINSVYTPTYGLKIRVKRELPLGALINVNFKGFNESGI